MATAQLGLNGVPGPPLCLVPNGLISALVGLRDVALTTAGFVLEAGRRNQYRDGEPDSVGRDRGKPVVEYRHSTSIAGIPRPGRGAAAPARWQSAGGSCTTGPPSPHHTNEVLDGQSNGHHLVSTKPETVPNQPNRISRFVVHHAATSPSPWGAACVGVRLEVWPGRA